MRDTEELVAELEEEKRAEREARVKRMIKEQMMRVEEADIANDKTIEILVAAKVKLKEMKAMNVEDFVFMDEPYTHFTMTPAEAREYFGMPGRAENLWKTDSVIPPCDATGRKYD